MSSPLPGTPAWYRLLWLLKWRFWSYYTDDVRSGGFRAGSSTTYGYTTFHCMYRPFSIWEMVKYWRGLLELNGVAKELERRLEQPKSHPEAVTRWPRVWSLLTKASLERHHAQH